MDYNLYPLLPSLKPCEPCEPLDTIDTQYLNQSHIPLINPLKKDLYIELYNDKWFNKPLEILIPPFTYQHDTLKLPHKSLLPFLSTIEFHDESNTCFLQPFFDKVDDNISNHLSPLALHK